MTHNELLAKVNQGELGWYYGWMQDALRAVVELHKPQEITLPNGEWGLNCVHCDGWKYPCPTIKTIESKLV
jgi:hypothetical protein